MPIEASTPTVVPASEEKVFDKYRVTGLNMNSRDPNSSIRVVATLHKARVLESGEWELSPDDREVRVVVKDLYALAATMPALATTMADVETRIVEIATDQKLIL